uniref:Uncharacterized protein n=1 Tax=viral metagenome TaxID=1070528 RepID=A0A6C0L900_9ZZZZ
MILDDLEDLEGFALIKSLFIEPEPFKGGGGGSGGGGGGGGGGRGSSSRNKNKLKDNPYFPIFIFFIILYSLTFIFFNTQGSSKKNK